MTVIDRLPARVENDDASLRRVAKGGTFSAAGMAGGSVLGFCLTLVVTHQLSTSSAGIFFSATAVYIVAQTFLSFGVGAGVVRFIPRLRSIGRSDEVPALLVIALAPVLILGVLGSAIAWLTAPFIAGHISHSDGSSTVTALRILALMLLPGVLETAVVECTRGFGSIRSYVLIHQLFIPFARPVLVLLLTWAGAPLWTVTLVWAAPLALAVAMAAVVLRRSLAALYPGGPPWPAHNRWRPLAGEYWSFTGTRGVAAVMEILLTWLDVLIVAAVLSPAKAAIYAAASRFITSGTLVLQALRLVLAPEISAALAQDQLKRASRTYSVATQWVISTSWPLYLSMAIFAPCILRIFGDSYRSGATALTILCCAMLVNLAAGNVSTVLLMGGKSRWVLADKAIALTVNVVGNIVLTAHFGIKGAAIAWALTILIDSLLSIYQVRRGMGVAGPIGTMALSGLMALACYGVLPLAGRLLGGTSLQTTVYSLALATVIYLPLLWRLRDRLELSLLVPGIKGRRRGRHAARGRQRSEKHITVTPSKQNTYTR